MARLTHAHEGELAVFLIGMTIRKPWRPDRWGPVLVAMPGMLRELAANRAAAEAGTQEWLGFLGARTVLGRGGPVVVQYWRGVEDIYAYAGAGELRHRPAWTAFNRRVRQGAGAVGIWHETFAVPAGGHESIYTDMDPTGLAAATGHVPVGRRGDTARERLTSAVAPG